MTFPPLLVAEDMMIKSIKYYFVLVITYCVILTGCSNTETFEFANGRETLQATTVTLKRNNLRTYIEQYQAKLFYMEIDNNIADFYVYDFCSKENRKIYTICDFALKGTSKTLIDDKLYFYVSIYQHDNLQNILYVMDFSANDMQIVSENSYSQKLIPLTEYNGKLLALQRNISDNGVNDTFIETINDRGESKKIALQNNSNNNLYSELHQLLYLDSNGTFLYIVEKEMIGSEVKYYVVKYDTDFRLLEKINITNLFIDYEITDNIGTFYAFKDFFCITDYSNNTIICKIYKGNILVLLCDSDIEYVESCSGNTSSEFFFHRGTNDIYVLDTQTGEMQIRNYNLNNDSSVIRCVLLYDDYLMIVKHSLSEDDHTEGLYLISQNL